MVPVRRLGRGPSEVRLCAIKRRVSVSSQELYSQCEFLRKALTRTLHVNHIFTSNQKFSQVVTSAISLYCPPLPRSECERCQSSVAKISF